MDESDLKRELGVVAGWLDRRTASADPAQAGRAGQRRLGLGRRGRMMAAAAALVALVAGAGIVADRWTADGTQVRTEQPPSDPTRTSQPVADDSAGSSWSGRGFFELPESGIAVADDGVLVLFDDAGMELARTNTPAISELQSGPDRMLAAVRPGEQVDAIAADIGEAPDGCGPAATGGGIRVALCGGALQQPQQVELVTPAGERHVLAEPPADSNGLGHWRSAIPSPDGRWVLATWSGECEVPTAFLLSTTDGQPVSVDGGDGLSEAVESLGIGWTPEGKAIVHFLGGLCGQGVEQPGAYLVEPDVLEPSLIIPQPAPDSSVHQWRLDGYGNIAERIFGDALAALGLMGCCGEPSHGGDALTAGAHWQGFEIPVGASPSDDPPSVPFNDLVLSSEPIHVAGVPATAGEADLGPFVAYTCGQRVWTFGGAGIGGDRPTHDAVASLAAAVLPYLGCTVGERPHATGHGPAGP